MSKVSDDRPVSQRKSTRVWCKGKVGQPHVPVLQVDHRHDHDWLNKDSEARCQMRSYVRRQRLPEGGWGPWITEDNWYCAHQQVCERCGKILHTHPLCPERPRGVPYWGWAPRGSARGDQEAADAR